MSCVKKNNNEPRELEAHKNTGKEGSKRKERATLWRRMYKKASNSNDSMAAAAEATATKNALC